MALTYAGRSGSKLFIEDRTADKNCLLAIVDALESWKGSIDLLLCLGDLAHQAKKAVTMCVWADLQHVATSLEIPRVAAVTGNHDIASRPDTFQNEQPSQFLRHLRPPFPYPTALISEEYTLHSYAYTDVGNMALVLVDTCSLHGYGGSKADDIYNKGHIAGATIRSIVHRLKNSAAHFYLVAMHHHPQRVDQLADPDYDQIPDGDMLLDELSKLTMPGIIVHGHKHLVSLRRAGASTNAPWLFSASSLAANAYENMERYFSNQFHLVEIERPINESAIRGKILSWEWAANHWAESENEVMRHRVGFGARRSVADIAVEVAKLVTSGFYPFADVVRSVADLPYLTTQDIAQLRGVT